MNFIDVPGRVLSKYFVFEGRASRSEYWWWFLITFVIAIVAEVINPGLSLIIIIFLGIPTIALNARRLHDLNRSGWLQLIGLIPFIGWILLPVILIPEGTHGPNTYGEDPVDRLKNQSRPTRPSPQQRSTEPAPTSRDTTPNPPLRSPFPTRSSGVLARNATVRLAMYVAATDGQLSQAKGVIVRDWALDHIEQDITDDKEHINDVIRSAFSDIESGNLVLGHITDAIRNEADPEAIRAAIQLIETIVEVDGPASDEESHLIERISTTLNEPISVAEPIPALDATMPDPASSDNQESFNELRVRNLHHVMDLLEDSFMGQHPDNYLHFGEASKRILTLEPLQEDWDLHVLLLESLEAAIHVFSRLVELNKDWETLWNPPSTIKAERVIVALGSSFHIESLMHVPDREGVIAGISQGWATVFNFDEREERILRDELAGHIRAAESPLVVISDNPTIFDVFNSQSDDDDKINFRRLAFIHNRVMLALGAPGEPLSEATLDSAGITLYGPTGNADVMDLLSFAGSLEGAWTAARSIANTMPR